MRRSTLCRCLSLLLALVLTACAAYQSQHGGGRSGGAPAPSPQAAAPGHDFTELPEDRQITRVRGEVDEAKKNLAVKGKYACCVRPACNECLLKRGECHCRHVAAKGGPCCGECTEAWVEGRGTIENLKAWDLLERKRQMLDENGQAPKRRQR